MESTEFSGLWRSPVRADWSKMERLSWASEVNKLEKRTETRNSPGFSSNRTVCTALWSHLE